MSQGSCHPLLESTMQVSKLRRAGYVFFVALIVLMSMQWKSAMLSFGAILAISIIACIFMLSAIVYSFVSIRCPICGLAWVRWSVVNNPAGQWLHWLYEFTSCPSCGYRGDDSKV